MGLYNFNTNKYLKLFKEDRDKEIVQASTINTNCWMKIFTGAVALSAIVSIIIQVLNMPDKQQNKDLLITFKNIAKSDSVQASHTYYTHNPNISLTDSSTIKWGQYPIYLSTWTK